MPVIIHDSKIVWLERRIHSGLLQGTVPGIIVTSSARAVTPTERSITCDVRGACRNN